MTARLAALIVTTCLCGHVSAQPAAAPNLTRQQRELLQALVTAVDAAATQPVTGDLNWQAHVMRASDGSHYVAFSIEPPASAVLPKGPAMLYLRLATSSDDAAQRIVERSGVREWLAGSRTDPRLLPQRGIAIGDMPAFGAGAIAARGSTASSGSNDLRLMQLERERARQEQEERDKKRRAELEGKAAAVRELFPFEDFDLASRSARADGARIITRAFTAGPGEYDLYVAWADPAAPKAATTIRVLRRPLQLPAATTASLTTGSIILADRVSVREAPYPATEQAAHPYSIGVMEILPARDASYTRDESLALVFQIINASPAETGLPDVAVGFRIVRIAGDRETPVASLNPQYYNATTLPPDFDLRRGHPLFAAVTAPLASLGRGRYRLKIAINDRVGGISAAAADTEFTIVGTPASLLAEAPPLGPAFKREAVLDPGALGGIVDALSPASPSPALARALAVARTGKLVDLLVEEPVPPAESGLRTALTGLALLSIGDVSSATQFQRALQQGVSASARETSSELRRDLAVAPTGRDGGPVAAIQFLLGAARAMQSRDPDAIAAWQAALAAGNAPAQTPQLLVEALLRRGDHQRAARAIADTPNPPATPAWSRVSAATRIAEGRTADAVTLLDAHLSSHPDDREARWLRLHAMYAQLIRGATPLGAATPEGRRFAEEARAYMDAKGAHAELVGEWLRVAATF
jgi:hypothetical protein